jgi:hypothetical protein
MTQHDQGLAVKKAELTLLALEAERDGILAGQAAMRRDVDAGKYDDER